MRALLVREPIWNSNALKPLWRAEIRLRQLLSQRIAEVADEPDVRVVQAEVEAFFPPRQKAIFYQSVTVPAPDLPPRVIPNTVLRGGD